MLKKFFLGAFMALSLAASSCSPAYAEETIKTDECYDKADLVNDLSVAATIEPELNNYIVATLNPEASRFFIKAFVDLGGPIPPDPWDAVTLVYNPGDPTSAAFLYIFNNGCATVNLKIPAIVINRLLQSASS